MQRYLLRIAFSGQNFSGSQKMNKRITGAHEWTEDYIRENKSTVQGALETMMLCLCPYSEVIANFASRVDRGVHALNMPVTVDLQKSKDGDVFYDPRFITFQLNQAFKKTNIDIQVLKTVAIHEEFKPRLVKSRTYLYRFAVMKQDKIKEFSHFYHNPSEELPNYGYLNRRLNPFFSYLPLKDQPYFTEVRDHFDLSKAEEALNLFNGEHNFMAFANRISKHQKFTNLDGNGNRAPGNTTVTMPEEYFIRSLSGIDIKKIPAPIEHNIYQLYELFDFYEFTLTAPSFYRNQIRRIAIIIFSVASGRLGLGEVRRMLNGEKKNWPGGLNMADPNGLYLANVEYDPEILKSASDNLADLPIGLSDLKRQPIEWDKMKPVMKFILDNNNSYFKVKAHEHDKPNEDNIEESLKDSETDDNT